MSATLSHPTRADLARCVSSPDADAELVALVRHHLEFDRCDACSAAVFDLLSTAGRAAERSALTQGWMRPERVARRSGCRVGAAADYQLVCSAGPYALDVLVRDYEDEHTLRFSGQVTRHGRIHEPVPELPLLLIGVPLPGDAATATDEFGEFSLASDRIGIYGLRLGAASDAPCVMVWEGWDA